MLNHLCLREEAFAVFRAVRVTELLFQWEMASGVTVVRTGFIAKGMVMKDRPVKARDVHCLLEVWVLQKALKYVITKNTFCWGQGWLVMAWEAGSVARCFKVLPCQVLAICWYSNSVMALNVHNAKQQTVLMIAPVGAHAWQCPQYWFSALSHALAASQSIGWSFMWDELCCSGRMI